MPDRTPPSNAHQMDAYQYKHFTIFHCPNCGKIRIWDSKKSEWYLMVSGDFYVTHTGQNRVPTEKEMFNLN